MKRSILVLMSLLAAPLAAHSQWYVGASAGQSKQTSGRSDVDAQFLGLGFDDASTSSDRRDNGYRLFFGNRFHRFAAVEAGYGELGRFESVTRVLPVGTLMSRARSSAVDVGLLGLLPLGERFTLFARGGGFVSQTKVSYSGAGSVDVIDGDTRDRTSGGLYGVGAMAAFNPHWSVRLDWTRYRRAFDDSLGPRRDLELWTVGAVYRF